MKDNEDQNTWPSDDGFSTIEPSSPNPSPSKGLRKAVDNEPQKVAEWAESVGFSKGPFTPNGQVFTHPEFQFGEYISETQMTFFYRAAHPEPVDGNEELKFNVLPDIFRPIGPGDDVVVSAEKLRNWRDELETATAQRILDRVEVEKPSRFGFGNASNLFYGHGYDNAIDEWARRINRIREEEL